MGNEEKVVQLYDQFLKQWQATVNKPEEARTAVLLAGYFSKKANHKEAVSFLPGGSNYLAKNGQSG